MGNLSGLSAVPGDPSTIVHLLRRQADSQPDQVIYTFLVDGETAGPDMTYAKLDQAARQIGACLQDMGAAGERALLIYPPGLEYISGFFGCLYSGVIAVPAYPPDPARLDQVLPKLLAIAQDSQATLALTTTPVLKLVQGLAARSPELGRLRWVATDSITSDQASSWKAWDPDPQALAYLQYTSGSTRQPKGVRLSHANLVSNSLAISRTFELKKEDVIVLWLPMYHNMGLVGGVLQPFYTGCACYLMSPLAFLQQPLRWLKAISDYRGTAAGGPNFGYDLLLQRVTPEQKASLDLSSWDLAFNGAEPVRPETIDRFSAAFASCGFRREAFYPCYGLAESTLMVTGGRRRAGPVQEILDRKALNSHQAVESTPASPNSQTLVGCGKSFAGQELLIVQPETLTALPESKVGELWISGPSVAQGYWNLPIDTAQTFQGFLSDGQGPYLRTGDLGFLQDGECFITGRLKDLIIIRGRNHYPQDIEMTVAHSHAGLIPNGSAAFSVDVHAEERLVIVQEIDPAQVGDLDETAQAIRQAVTETHELQVYALVLVEPHSIPKTQSGKVQRQACRKEYLSGTLKTVRDFTLDLSAAPAGLETDQPAVPARQESLLHAALLALGPQVGQQLLENHLQEKVAGVLKVPPSSVDVRAPLTSLGLDSILAVELAEQVETTLDVSLPMASLLQGASLSDLARGLLGQLFQGKKDPSPPRIKPLAPTQPEDLAAHVPAQILRYPLSYGQRALWFVQRLVPESVAHNIVYAGRFRAPVDFTAYRRAFERLVDRHPVLRTTFVEEAGQPVQCVQPAGSFEFTVEDISSWPPEQVETRLAAEVLRPFDLEKGPLLRAIFLRQAEDRVILLLALHHTITDMWSMAIFLHDLGEFYLAETGGSLPHLRPLEDTYQAEVARQAEMVSGLKGEADWAYWRQRLSGELPALNLPADRPRPPVQIGRGAAHTIRTGSELARALKDLARATQSNLFSILLSAFDILLYRYTGQTDLVIGSPKAGRSRKNAGVMGYFINPVLLRADLSGEPTFRQLVARLTASVREDFEHDAFPYPLLVERLQPARDAGRGALFQIFFSWQKTTRVMDSQGMSAFALGEEHTAIQLGGVPLETLPLKQRVTPTDLALLVAETEDDLAMTIEYSTDLFESATIQRVMGHLCILLQEAIKDPDRPISGLPLLSEAELRQLIEEWNPPYPALPDEKPVHESIRDQARRAMLAPALVFADQTLTYVDLDRRSDHLARWLCAWGAAPGIPVGVCMERSLESIIALLGVLKSGAVYLPLDPEYPADRLAYMLADSRAPVVLTQRRLLDRLPEGTGAHPVCLDDDWSANSPCQDGRPVPSVELEDPAYLMYTSGSTGQPKGVLVSHRAIAQHARFMREYYQITPSDRALQFASPNFDPSLEQVFTTLMAGAVLYLRDVELWDPAVFSQKIAERGLTIVNIPPPYWQQWVQAETRGPGLFPNPQLRLVIIGGDVVQPETLALWQSTPYREARLINAYGPTEAVITAVAYDIPFPYATSHVTRIPIGRPLGGRCVHLLDPNLQPVPVGVPGHLHIGGVCLAQGYLNHPELSAEKFISDPFHTGPAARMYRTGDLARWLPDGNLEFLGRIDRQVKIRGMRIEPGEIEAALERLPGVKEAVVLPVPGENGAQLAAFLVSGPGEESNLSTLPDALARQLPAYMLPAVFIPLENLPLTPSGKLDRDALAHRALLEITHTAQEYAAPRSALEERLACIWAELLHVERVGITDNFFSLGGHSLLATQLASRLREEFHVELPLRRLFETPTVAGLALAVAQTLAAREDADELDRLLAEIEDLPDEQAADQLRLEDTNSEETPTP